MFEAVITACLIAAPDLCRDMLIPGYEAPQSEACETSLAARPPDRHEDPKLLVTGAPFCTARGMVLPVEEVAPGIFVHMGAVAEPDAENRGDVANLGFVIGEASVAVIDTGSARWMGEALWRAIREHTDLPVRHVILTHMHPDHAFGAAAFAATGALIVGHAALPRALADRQANYIDSLDRLVGRQVMIGTRSVSVDLTVEETLTIALGDRVLRLDAWPMAHTGTDVTVLDAQSGILFAGDLVFHLHTPALDGSLQGWRAVLNRLDALEADRVVPGHGGPLLDWPEGVAPLRRYLDVLEDDTRSAIKAGQRLSEAVETIAAGEAQAWELFDAYNPRNATVAFTELEWE